MNRTELVLELFNPDENGVSRWVKKTDMVGKYETLYPTNGNHWYRNRGLSHLILEKKKDEQNVDCWRFNGLKENKTNRSIRKDIRDFLIKKPCVITNIISSDNEIDHRDGRYPDEVMDIKTQKVEHFQTLHPTLNKQKRSDCLKCKNTGLRYDAKDRGCTVSVVSGNINYEGSCIGCFWYDPKLFLK